MRVPNSPTTVLNRLQTHFDNLTRAERQLVNSLQENYPVSGLGSITTVAGKAGVSAPTVARLVQKIGFRGFAEFQTALRDELEARITGPIAKHDNWAGAAPTEHLLNRFTDAVLDNIRQTLSQVDHTAFDATCDLFADTGRHLFIAGGRVTRMVADYLFLHMQVIRPAVTNVQSISNAWPHYLLNMEEGDVLAIFDIRRYENSTLRLAEMAHERGARIILFTDQWRSPVDKFAEHSFGVHIEVPSAWDSSVGTLLLVETIIAAVETRTWDETRDRMHKLEGMFDQTRLFRKFK
jgi:DNA-binding MurR/RpiR family transcriptional regulator